MKIRTRRNIRLIFCGLFTLAIVCLVAWGFRMITAAFIEGVILYWAITALIGMTVIFSAFQAEIKIMLFVMLILLPYFGQALVLYCCIARLFGGDRKQKVGQYVDYRQIQEKGSEKITYFSNGKDYFEDYLATLQKAEEEVLIYTYIFRIDEATCKLATVLFGLLARGVKVSLFADYYGSGAFYKDEMIGELKKRGARVGCYKRPGFLLLFRDNVRCHGKITLIDRKIAYLPSMNMAEKEIYEDKNCAVKVVGGLEGWLSEFAPILKVNGGSVKAAKCGIMPILCRAGHGAEGTFLWATSQAAEEITLVTPYCSLNDVMKKQLRACVERGVTVNLVVADSKTGGIPAKVTRFFAKEAAHLGVRSYFFNKRFLHSKILIVDKKICMVGSANFDVRSYYYATETVAISRDNRLIEPLLEDVDQLIAESEAVGDYERQSVLGIKKKIYGLISFLV